MIDIRSGPLGADAPSATVQEVMAALQGFNPDQGWKSVAARVIPLFQRVRPYPWDFPDPVRIVLPPGVSVTFAIDMGPAFTHISADFLERWGLTIQDVASRALANLDRRAADAVRIRLVTDPVDGVPLRTLQSGTGSASTFVLVPDRLAAIFGSEPQYFIAPMRDILISLPADVDRDFAAWLLAEFAELDPNHLAPVGFPYRNGEIGLEPLGGAIATA